MEDLRYPIGKFDLRAAVTVEDVEAAIEDIAACPAHLRAAVKGLSDNQLDTRYREGGWTVRQVVHHIPDSHMNAYMRTKLAITENHPRVKPYDEALWAELQDGRTAPVEISLSLLEPLHARWVTLLRSLTSDQLNRTIDHPESGVIPLDRLVAMYGWHGRHHVAHITRLRERMGWR